MNNSLYIIAQDCICSLGHNEEDIYESIANNKLSVGHIGTDPIITLPSKTQEELKLFLSNYPKYKKLDPCVQYAIFTAHHTFLKSNIIDDNIGINIGSSRGATSLWESDYNYFTKKGKSKLLTSPLTTLGNISSNVAKHLEIQGPCISHSITCSTSLQAIVNAYAWMQADLIDYFMVGGSEAPNTLFTIEQMKALKIYSKLKANYPCQPFSLLHTNTMTLGEGAASFLLSKKKTNAISELVGIGYQVDTQSTMTGIPDNGENLYKSMKMATKQVSKVDLVICHAPGTLKGDQAEINAIDRLFKHRPILYSTKHLTGHTLGASGAISMYIANLILKHQFTPNFPYPNNLNIPTKSQINTILINAVGFGGNATSILLKRVS